MEDSILRLSMQHFAEGEAESPAASAETTPPSAATAQAAQVDIEKIEQIVSERMSKSGENIFKQMLEKQGFDTEAVNKMAEEWKSKQKTPEQIAKEKDDEIVRLSGELEQEKNKRVAISKGVPDELMEDYMTLAAAQPGNDFATKIDAALAKFPLVSAKEDPPADKPPLPSFAAKTGSGQNPNLDEFEKRLNKYRRN